MYSEMVLKKEPPLAAPNLDECNKMTHPLCPPPAASLEGVERHGITDICGSCLHFATLHGSSTIAALDGSAGYRQILANLVIGQ